MQFDIAISLGFNCQARHQLSRILTARHGSDAGGGSFFFDWQWRNSGLSGVTQVIENDFKFSASDFVIKLVADHYEGFLPQYGLYFTHDFNFKDVSLEGLEAALAAQVGEVSEKYARRADRMKRVLGSGKRILFVLCGPLTLTEINAFNSVVESHYPQLHYMIVHVPFSNYGHAKVEHPKVHSHPVVTEYYPGNDQGWDEALEGIDIQPVPQNIEEFLTGGAILTYA